MVDLNLELFKSSFCAAERKIMKGPGLRGCSAASCEAWANARVGIISLKKWLLIGLALKPASGDGGCHEAIHLGAQRKNRVLPPTLCDGGQIAALAMIGRGCRIGRATLLIQAAAIDHGLGKLDGFLGGECIC